MKGKKRHQPGCTEAKIFPADCGGTSHRLQLPAVVVHLLVPAFIIIGYFANPADAADLLQLSDGSSLQGDFIQIDNRRVITFKHKYIQDQINFASSRIDWLRFDSVHEFVARENPNAYFSFVNGDHIYGRMTGISEGKVGITTITGDQLSAPREFLQSVTHLPDGFNLLYEGPMGNDGWRMTRRSGVVPAQNSAPAQPGWQFRNGIFMAEGPGILGQTFPLKDTVYVEFDLSWIGFFSLYVGIFSDTADSYDYRSQSYRLTLSPASAAMQKIQPNMRLYEFGRVRFPEMQETSRVSLGLLINRVDNKVTLFKDKEVVQEFSDKQTSIPSGNSIVFSSNSTGPYLKITRLHISTWSGNQPFFAPRESSPDRDIVYLRNTDQVDGTISSVKADSIAVATDFFEAEIPSRRVVHYSFSTDSLSSPQTTPGKTIRASLFGGGSLAVDLQSWEDGVVSGLSPVFGELQFKSDLVRQVVFNGPNAESNSDDSSNFNFDFGDGFQEVIWDDPIANP